MATDLSQSNANSANVGGNGSYQPTATEESAPFKVQLGEHLDSRTKRSLQSSVSTDETALQRNPVVSFVQRYPLPLLLTLGGAIWLWRSRSRRSF